MARVAVTGGMGFIGQHLVEHLVRRGDQVRCLVHSSRKRIPDAELVTGDIREPGTLTRFVQDAEIVYHLAGATMVISPQYYKPINGEGTRNLGEACARLPNPPTLVFLSSIAAAGPTMAAVPRNELQPPSPVSEYGRSKLLGERYLRQMADRLPVTVLRPPGVFGPGDSYMLRLFLAARFGFNLTPGAGNQRLGLIYVTDLVESMLQAAAYGERLSKNGGDPDHPQGVYFVAMDECPTMVELGNFAGSALNRSQVRHMQFHPFFGKLLGRINDFVGQFTRRPRLLTTDKMREALAGSWTCSADKAKQAWGFHCRTGIVEGFRKTVDWYRAHGWL